MLEGQGIAARWRAPVCSPAPRRRCCGWARTPGSLDTQLEVTAEYYETELDYKIAKLTALFEPIVIVAMGLIVGFVAVALVSAMCRIFRQVDV